VLRRAQLAVFQDFFMAFAPFDIRPAQYSVLTVIERNPGLTQSQVAEALGIKRTNFVGMLDALEARGLTERRPGRARQALLCALPHGRGRGADAQAQAGAQRRMRPA
jgi:DNA-binding MarR family transcriptional regulator